MLKVVSTNKAPHAIGPYSQAIIHGNMIYTSGQIGLNNNGVMQEGIKSQTRQVLENLEEILKEANSSFDLVIKTTIFLADMSDFDVVNGIYGEYFKNHKPARSTIAVKTLPKGALVEIECIAVVN